MRQGKGFRLPPKGALSNPAQQKLEKAIALHQQGRLLEAKFLYDDILKSNPNHFDALHLSGLIAYQGKNLDDALGLFGRAIRIKTSFAPLHSNYGLALQALGRLEEAVASYGKAIKLNPNFAEAYTNRGVALKELGRWDEALASYDKAIRVKPDYAEAYVNRAHALKELKRPDEALASYDMALTLKPGHAENHLSRGVVLRELRRLDEARLSFERAISIAPNYAEAHFNLGVALYESGGRKRLSRVTKRPFPLNLITPQLTTAMASRCKRLTVATRRWRVSEWPSRSSLIMRKAISISAWPFRRTSNTSRRSRSLIRRFPSSKTMRRRIFFGGSRSRT